MKRIIITSVLLLGTSLAAQAGPVATYYDLIRTNGHPRSAAVHQSDLDACYGQTGQSRYELDGPAFKQCMLGRGYRFVSQHNVQDARSRSGSSDDQGEDQTWINNNSQPPINDPSWFPPSPTPPPDVCPSEPC